ncbi:hypothetical protein RB195_016871 [Necator americanus]|uniref:PiggyBac transposable element-derived protein domain-containing protein n=1 Tax=Necator americanus TaxID=51031 RepID=A0ABR1C5P8_NECAM
MRKKNKDWAETTVDELRHFIDTCLDIEIVRLSKLRDYWFTDPIQPDTQAKRRKLNERPDLKSKQRKQPSRNSYRTPADQHGRRYAKTYLRKSRTLSSVCQSSSPWIAS